MMKIYQVIYAFETITSSWLHTSNNLHFQVFRVIAYFLDKYQQAC